MKATRISQDDVLQGFRTTHSANVEVYRDYTFVTYWKNNAIPIVAVFEGKRGKPLFHYSFLSEAKRTEYIAALKLKRDKAAEEQAERQKVFDKRKEQVQPGSILISTWGYEQTNVDYYLVLERHGDYITIQPIGKKDVTYNGQHCTGTCKPDENKPIGDPFRKKLNKFGGISLTSYSSAYLWDGKENYYSDG